MRPIVRVSLDNIDLREALDTAAVALCAGVDWLGESLIRGLTFGHFT